MVDFVLSHILRPVCCRSISHRGTQGKNRLLSEVSIIEHNQLVDHRWLVHERQVEDGLWNSILLYLHLNENLGDDTSQVLPSEDGLNKDNFGRNGLLSQ